MSDGCRDDCGRSYKPSWEVSPVTVKIVSWNIAGIIAPWHGLISMDTAVSLLQEAAALPLDLAREGAACLLHSGLADRVRHAGKAWVRACSH